MALPKIEVPIFSGQKGEDFILFMETVENVIERNCLDEGLRFQQLLARTSGKAKSYIKDCMYLPHSSAYRSAKEILKERYGTPAEIVRTALDKLSKGPTLRQSDKEGLLDLNAEISSVHRILNRLDCRLDADAPERLRQIVLRLPYSWRTNFLKRLELRMPNFSDLVTFMNDSIKITRNPFFTDCFMERGGRSGYRDEVNNNYGQDEEGGELRPPTECFVCSKDHMPWKCDVFRELNVEERVKLLLKNRRCLNCIGRGHIASKCPKPTFCKVGGCASRLAHNRLCHPLPDIRKLLAAKEDGKSNINDTQAETEAGKSEPDPKEGEAETITQATLGGASSTYLQVVPLKVYNEEKSRLVITYAILDSGSDSVIVDMDVVHNLQISGKSVYTKFRSSTNEARLRTELVNLVVTSLDDGPEVFLPGAKGIQDCAFKKAAVPPPAEIRLHEHLRDVAGEWPTLDSKFDKPLLLIGTNASECFLQKDVRKGNGLMAIKGVLGWSVMGNRSTSRDDGSDNVDVGCNITETLDTAELDRKVELFWKLEEISASQREKGLSVHDRISIQIMDSSKTLISDFDGPHYRLSILWKEFPPPLVNNRSQALQRLLGLKRRFEKHPNFFEMYKTQIEDYVRNGYASSTQDQPLHEVSGVNYIPHHGVVSAKKPDKVRAVFNCASVSPNGMSLNDCIYSGPDNTNRLVSVLLRWREGRIAICADVEAMYHRVRVNPRDYSFLRFLWFKDSNLDGEIVDFYMKVHLFGCISSSACANYALQQTARDFSDNHPPFVIESVMSSFYVDDFVQSHDDLDVAVGHCKELRSLLSKGGFVLKKFDSNSQDVFHSFSSDDLSPSREEGRIQSVLGIDWSVSKDVMILSHPSSPKPSTRCGILGFIMERFDPLGLEAPIVFPVKCLLQELCRKGLDWRTELPSPLLEKWHAILSDIVKSGRVELPRCYKPEKNGLIVRTELHTFCDASSLGYACVTYLRFSLDDGHYHVTLVAAKSRVAPMKSPTIRRLEFQGALTAARQSAKIVDSLTMKIDDVYFWTDCTTVLKYLRNDRRRFQVYIANRIQEIHETTSVKQWRYVPSVENCADDATRILPATTITATSRWYVGPPFLYLRQEEWPSQPTDLRLDPDDPEIKSDVFSNAATSVSDTSFLDDYFKRFSTLSKLVRTTAWVQRLLQISRSRRADADLHVTSTPMLRPGTLTLPDLRRARDTVLMLCQRQAFAVEYEEMSKGSGNPVSKSSPLYPLGVTMIDGLIRLKGRLRHAEIHLDARNPVVLPKTHPLTTLIIRDVHVLHGHQGMNYVLGEIRTKYWIIHGKVAIAKELRRCVPCQRYNARPMEQLMSDLPPERLTAPDYPFQYTGLDVFGPFIVSIGRRTKKVWVVIFSCLSYRCIHLEIIMTMKTDSFILAYRKFISRRGSPVVVVSDRGSNFVSAERELREAIIAWNQSKIDETLIQNGTEWRFNAAGASHHGGVYERLIRSCRSVLNHTLHNNRKESTELETFQTIIAEVESILNGRPLQAASSDPKDLTPLTPNHVLLMRSNPNLPPGLFKDSDSQLRKRWKVCQSIVNQASRRLMKDYITALNVRSKWLKIRESIAMNDLVLICDQGHRSEWKLGRVTKLFHGRDGLIRSVGLRTVSAKSITRPISKICLLEGIANDFKS